MRQRGLVWLLCLTLPLTLAARVRALEAEELIPGGSAVGIELTADGVMIVGLTEVETEQGTASPAAEAGLLVGDVIRGIDGRGITNVAAFLTAMGGLNSGAHRLEVQRDGEMLTLTATPARNREGAYQFGLFLRDGVSGIGTVTFYDPVSGTFGALGHGINDLDTGRLLPFDDGSITDAEVVDVIPGKPGNPGELCGEFDGAAVLGSLRKNTESGIFGTALQETLGSPIPVGKENEVVLGPAVIRSCVDGGAVEEYAVEISRIYRDPADNRFLLVTVTDPALLAVTGGIVQGMSGSPIIQNGKLVGAVTHVLISDPTKGYGISMERMLQAA